MRLQTLLGYLKHDSNNLELIAEAVNVAFDTGNLDQAGILIEQYRIQAPLTKSLVNVEGLVALRSGRLEDAAGAFDALLTQGTNEPSVRFNRAWVHALKNEHTAALDLLDDATIAAVPRAASLKVQMMHHLGQIEEALAEGQAMVEKNPQDDTLLGALSVAAMDADDMALARHYADQAKGGADALTTQGLLRLNDDDPAASLVYFEKALTEQQDAPRAWLGKGLGLLAMGDNKAAGEALTRGAEIFGDHLGSWIAVAWTQFIGKDLKSARTTFERALALDENFAETHGGLAVLDVAEGDHESAKRRANIALRLDRECFGAMLAKMLLHEAGGNAAAAQQIWERAMDLPAGVNGKTLTQSMIGLGLNPGRSNDGAQ
jgi:tetratricopeptide (TPR) repeat protein